MGAISKIMRATIEDTVRAVREAAKSGDEDAYFDAQYKLWDAFPTGKIPRQLTASHFDPDHPDLETIQSILNQIRHHNNAMHDDPEFGHRQVYMPSIGVVGTNQHADDLSDAVGELWDHLAPFKPPTVQ